MGRILRFREASVPVSTEKTGFHADMDVGVVPFRGGKVVPEGIDLFLFREPFFQMSNHPPVDQEFVNLNSRQCTGVDQELQPRAGRLSIHFPNGSRKQERGMVHDVAEIRISSIQMTDMTCLIDDLPPDNGGIPVSVPVEKITTLFLQSPRLFGVQVGHTDCAYCVQAGFLE